MLRFVVHYGIHFILPLFIVFFFFRENRLSPLLILWAGICIDVDHLLAYPVFDQNRCSIGFHPLHSYWAIGLYLGLTVLKKTRIFGIALLLHILADMADCFLMD